ncbi:hypothetical protein HPP92_010393 [Vanilla planifolia]|uniref:Uncharacterized protein n=1 Tax=Vanilla planifolia TaxID=51239 RepID=A0A835R0R6_VANPL|nr:hypothetical protein HPP92_010393 [Vanilla planifolia]
MLFYVRNQSFAIKSSIESSPKPNSSANVVGINKEITSIERKFAAVYSSTKTKLDNNHSELTTKGSCSNVNVCLSNNGKQIAELQDIAERPKDSKPPSIGDQKDKSMEKDVLVSHSPHWMEVGHPLARVVHEEDLRLSKTTSDSIQKKAPCKVPDYGRENLREFENCSKNLEYLNLLETKPFNSMQLCTATSSAQREYFSNKVAQRLLGSEKEDEAKSKKLKKFSLAKGSFFGCKRLLFMSLYQQKKNRMGSKKRYQNSRNRIRKKMLYHSITSSSEPSTSQTSQGADIGSEHLSGKHAHSAACRKLKRKEGAKLGCSSVHFEERNSTNMAVQDASDQLCGHSYSRMESIVKQELSKDVVIQNFSANLLMTSLKETPVARWDDKNLMTHPVDETEYNPKRNIGYVVDEWDEEYDRGKRKKVKNSRQWPDAGDPNPFQETANFMARKKMKVAVERKRSENPPFRI